jgi:predicted oxidoreductase (fatty acid repression mutant protein)
VIDEALVAEFHVPASWKLRGQLNFGSKEGDPGDKTFMDDADRFIVVK